MKYRYKQPLIGFNDRIQYKLQNYKNYKKKRYLKKIKLYTAQSNKLYIYDIIDDIMELIQSMLDILMSETKKKLK